MSFIAAAKTLLDGVNWILGTTTGSQLGTGPTQKLGLWGATPIVQPGSTTDLRQAMINVGMLATGGASPLNLNGGALTAGSATVNGNVIVTGVILSSGPDVAAFSQTYFGGF